MKSTSIKKLLFYFLLFSLSGQLYSQKGLYLKTILIERAVSHNKYPFSLTVTNSDGLPITITKSKYIFQKGGYSGCFIGYNFKRLSIESGFIFISTSSGATIRGFSYDSTTRQYNSTYNSFLGGVRFSKIPFRFNYHLLRLDSIKQSKFTFGIDLNLGIDFLVSPMGDPNKPLTGGTNTFYSKNGSAILIDEDLYNTSDYRSYLRTIGLSFIVGKKKGTNILNLTILYSLGVSALSEERIQITMPNGERVMHREYSNGSGFYYSITKAFYLDYYLKKRQKKMKELYEKRLKNSAY